MMRVTTSDILKRRLKTQYENSGTVPHGSYVQVSNPTSKTQYFSVYKWKEDIKTDIKSAGCGMCTVTKRLGIQVQSVVESDEHCSATFGSIKGREFFDGLSDCELLKMTILHDLVSK
jgi:hypothetical protein